MTIARLLAALLIASGIWALPVPAGEKLGSVHFPVSCSVEAQARFDRAVALLHSFHFAESIKAFTAVAAADPTCGMAHWGVAMTVWGNPLGGPPGSDALREGWSAVEKARAAGVRTDRERAYLAAVEAFYGAADRVDHRTRILAYERAMERVHRSYPDDSEAAVFYALALNATALPTDKTYGNQLRAAAILERVFAAQPDHPGAAHLLIHSYDYPPLAARGLDAARRYAAIAPSAPHALHMPSHIFTRLGYWQESIDSNRASAAAAMEYAAGNPALAASYRTHALDYMMYATLQLARDREAKAIMDEVAAIRPIANEHLGRAFALAAIPARYALERHRWAEAAQLALRPADYPWDRFPQAEAITHFARALGAARSGDAATARGEAERLATLRDSLAAAGQGYWADQVEIQRRLAAAVVARAEGLTERAFAAGRSAAELEATTEKHVVTPGPIVPARELLGELYLEAGQPRQALHEFEGALGTEPNRFWSLYGAARAAAIAGDGARARDFYTKLVTLCAPGDTDRPEVAEARAFLARN